MRGHNRLNALEIVPGDALVIAGPDPDCRHPGVDVWHIPTIPVQLVAADVEKAVTGDLPQLSYQSFNHVPCLVLGRVEQRKVAELALSRRVGPAAAPSERAVGADTSGRVAAVAADADPREGGAPAGAVRRGIDLEYRPDASIGGVPHQRAELRR